TAVLLDAVLWDREYGRHSEEGGCQSRCSAALRGYRLRCRRAVPELQLDAQAGVPTSAADGAVETCGGPYVRRLRISDEAQERGEAQYRVHASARKDRLSHSLPFA